MMSPGTQQSLISTILMASLSLTTITGCDKLKALFSKSSAAPVTENVIQIGEVSSLTGSEATFGVSTHRALEIAVDEVNKSGGIKGKTVQLITLDDQGKPEEAATAVTKLITQNSVVAIVGEVASSRSLAMAPIAQANHVPMLSPSSTNPKVTQQGDYIFRVCFIDPFQGTVMARFAGEHLKLKKVAILRDVKNDYSMGLADYFKETFTKGGGAITMDQSYSAGDIDFKSQLTSIRETAPEAIFVPGYYTEVGLIARQARELGISVPLLGGDGWDSPKLTEIGGTAVEGSYFSNHYSSENPSPQGAAFIAKYKDLHGTIPDALAAMGYDAGLVLFDAMKRAPTLDPKDLREALGQTRDFEGATGKITIDQNRDAIKSAVVLKVEHGKFKYQATVHPGA